MNNKIIILRREGRILTALMGGGRVIQLNLEEEESGSLLGNIYIAKVNNVAKNINAAFLDLGGGQTAYYSLTENSPHLLAQDPLGSQRQAVRPGDEILVQVSRDAVKTKDPVVTSHLSFTGRFCVVTAGRFHIGFSSKISDPDWKNRIRSLLSEEKDSDFGIIIRTNARQASDSEILAELRELKEQYHKLLREAPYRTCYTLLYEAVPSFLASLRDTYHNFMEEIITDDPDIYRQIQEYLERHQPEDTKRVRLYEDSLVSLGKLYSIEKAVEEALQKKVWLKSGGYLVIEPTEAMTVIDVNSGKYTGKKDQRDTILKTNLEAAKEIAYQMRLRNLSGIILIDFIDMTPQEDRDQLMNAFTSYCMQDPIKTTVVDMTRLGLVEVTRKKIRKPFREQTEKGEHKS